MPPAPSDPAAPTARTDARAGRGAAAPYAVFGGTGFLGRAVVQRLAEDGHRVRVVARHPDAARPVPGAEPLRADILRPETIGPALDGAAGVVNAVSLYVERGEARFDTVHVEAAARLADMARQAGVARVVHVSGIGADPASGDAFVRARGRGEAAVRVACPDAVIVRPAVMVGDGDALRSAILSLTRFQPFFPLFGSGGVRLQPVHRDDVARAIARLLTGPPPAPLYEFGGAEVYSYAGLVRSLGAAAGRRIRPFPLPFTLWHGLAAVAEHLPGAPLTRAQVALMQGGNVAAPDLPGLADLGIAPTDILADLRLRSASS